MDLVERARRAVVATNRWPGFETLYQRAYDVGLAYAARRLGSVPGVLAVLLRANDDDRSWTPGLSDYDLGVLVDRLDAPRALPLLDALWGRYRSIKRLVPQMGEMEVLGVEELDDTLTFGPSPTASIKRAVPLRVRRGRPDVERVLERRGRPAGEPELLLDALSRFSRFAYPAWLVDRAGANRAPDRRTAHLLGNVSKRLARLGVPTEAAAEGTAVERTLRVFRALSRACSRMEPDETDPGVVEAGAAPIPDPALHPLRSFCEATLRRAAVDRCSAVAWISHLSADRPNLVFVVPDDLADDELGRLLVALKAERRAAETVLARPERARTGAPRSEPPAHPTVSSESMWRCWRRLSPFDGAAVAARGRTIVGETGRVHAVPSRAALRRGAEVQYAALLPLKNNWRVSEGPPPGEAYVPLVDHARACAAAAATGRVRTVPAALELGSTEEGYRAADEALSELRARLLD